MCQWTAKVCHPPHAPASSGRMTDTPKTPKPKTAPQGAAVVVDWEKIESYYIAIAATGLPHGMESDILRLFKAEASTENFEDRIPLTKLDTIVYEMAFKFGRADIVVFHIDGSASVIEVKDGTKGYNHVVAGIGQAALYASQLGMNKGALTKVRKCLLWTSTGNVFLDGLIEECCESAGTTPLPWGNLGVHLAYAQAVNLVVGKVAV